MVHALQDFVPGLLLCCIHVGQDEPLGGVGGERPGFVLLSEFEDLGNGGAVALMLRLLSVRPGSG